MKKNTNFSEWLKANAELAAKPCTWEDMSASCYSDVYKDAHGFRPRHAEVPFKTVGDLYIEIDSLVAYWQGGE